MSLQSYLNNRWISPAEPSHNQIATLLAIADRDIAQSQTPGLGPEWRFDIAYNAALQAATAALAAAGFQAERQNKHMRTIECLAFTIGMPQSDIDVLDACRRKRHKAVYDQVGAISDQEANEMLAIAQHVRRLVEEWIRYARPDLVS